MPPSINQGNQALRSLNISAIAIAERDDQGALFDVNAVEKLEGDGQGKGRACFQLAREKPQAGGMPTIQRLAL